MDWSANSAQMDWWVHRLRPFTDYCVGSTVPNGFESIGRLFHPIDIGENQTETWATLAKRNSRTAHPDMQLHAIATPRAEPVQRATNGPSCWSGDLPERETFELRDIATRNTGTPDTCYFGVWDGYGSIRSAVTSTTAVGSKYRKYFLLEGALSDMAQARKLLGHQTPNLWWPHDRSWFIATEIDFCWTLIGGTASMIAELETHDRLEVMATSYDANHTVDGDTINR